MSRGEWSGREGYGKSASGQGHGWRSRGSRANNPSTVQRAAKQISNQLCFFPLLPKIEEGSGLGAQGDRIENEKQSSGNGKSFEQGGTADYVWVTLLTQCGSFVRLANSQCHLPLCQTRNQARAARQYSSNNASSCSCSVGAKVNSSSRSFYPPDIVDGSVWSVRRVAARGWMGRVRQDTAWVWVSTIILLVSVGDGLEVLSKVNTTWCLRRERGMGLLGNWNKRNRTGFE